MSIGVVSSAWLGDRKSTKLECKAAALAFPFALRSPNSIPIGFIWFVSKTGDVDFNWVWKLATSLSLQIHFCLTLIRQHGVRYQNA